MSVGLYSGTSGLALGVGLWGGVPGLWGGAAGLIDGLGATLDLNFLTGTLPSTITFSRGSNATLTDSTGKITYAPNNLVTNSDSFVSWAPTGATVVSNSTTAPDGTTTADTVVASAGATAHALTGNSAGAQNSSLVGSVYFKAGTYNFVQIFFGGSATPYANFNLSAGTSSAFGAGTVANITAVGNGWYRCSVFSNILSLSSLQFGLVTSLSAARAESWTAAGTETVFVWGAQLEAVTYQTTPGTYNSTTPKNLLGYTQEFDNAAWTKSNSFVQTNLLTYSEQFDNAAWVRTNASVTANTIAAPNGTLTADKLVSSAVAGFHLNSQSATTTAATYTYSAYIKAAEYTNATLSNGTGGTWCATFDLVAGTAGATFGAAVLSSAISNVGGGWYRCSVTFTATAAAILHSIGGYPSVGATVNGFGAQYTGDGTSGIFIWGAQLVQGATAGDYQPTYAAAAAVQYAAPDGTLSADKLVENAVTAFASAGQAATIVVGTSYTFSVYGKRAEWRYMALAPNGSPDFALFDLQNGVVTTKAASTVAAITPLSNGWFRCSLTYTEASLTSRTFAVLPNNTGTFASQTGDGTSGIYVWGAQLSNSASLDTYAYNPGAAPTSAAYYGPRFDYDPVTLAPKGLLIEEQRTNLVTYSGDTSNVVWAGGGCSKTSSNNSDPSGTSTAMLATADGANTTHFIFLNQTISFTSGVTYTQSLWVKAGTADRIQLTFGSPAFGASQYANFYLNGAGSVTASVGGTATIAPYSNGWYRITFTAAATVTTTSQSIFALIITSGTDGRTPSNTSTGTFYLWGAQLEAGAFATSYIPTVASSVTRSADVASMLGTNFASWYNQNEGTFVVAADSVAATANQTKAIAIASDGTTSNRLYMLVSTAAAPSLAVTSGNVSQASIATSVNATNNTVFRTAVAYKLNDFAITANGTSPVLSASGLVPSGNSQFALGYSPAGSPNQLNGHIRTLSYYNTRLPNDQLQAISA